MKRWFQEHLVPGARQAWRWWSLRLNAIGIAILAWVQFDPVSVLAVWNMMPVQVRTIIPGHTLAGLALIFFVLAMMARMVRQPKLENK